MSGCYSGRDLSRPDLRYGGDRSTPPPRQGCIELPFGLGGPAQPPKAATEKTPGQRPTVMSFFGLPDLPNFGEKSETPSPDLQEMWKHEKPRTHEDTPQVTPLHQRHRQEHPVHPKPNPAAFARSGDAYAAPSALPGRLGQSRVEERLAFAASRTRGGGTSTPNSAAASSTRAAPQAPEVGALRKLWSDPRVRAARLEITLRRDTQGRFMLQLERDEGGLFVRSVGASDVDDDRAWLQPHDYIHAIDHHAASGLEFAALSEIMKRAGEELVLSLERPPSAPTAVATTALTHTATTNRHAATGLPSPPRPAMVQGDAGASITTDQLAAERLARARAHNQLIIQAANHTYTKMPTPPKHPERSHPTSTLHDRPFHSRQELLDGRAAQLQRKPKSTWSRGMSLLRAVGLRRSKASATPRLSAVCTSADDNSTYQDEDAELSGLAVDIPSTQKPSPNSVVDSFDGGGAMRTGVATTATFEATRASATRATTESFSRPQTCTRQPSPQQPSVRFSPQSRMQSFSRPAPQQPSGPGSCSQPTSAAPTYTQPARRTPKACDAPRALGGRLGSSRWRLTQRSWTRSPRLTQRVCPSKTLQTLFKPCSVA